MREILRRLWTEPAYFTSVVAAIGVTVLQIVDWPSTVEIPLSALLVLAGGHVTRQLVTPKPRPDD